MRALRREVSGEVLRLLQVRGQGGRGEGWVQEGEGAEEGFVLQGCVEGLGSGSVQAGLGDGFWGWDGDGVAYGLSRRTSGSQCSDGLGGGGLLGWEDCGGGAGVVVCEGVWGGRGGPFVVGV